ncbi:MAG: electron transport protein SCO1/SenC [Solirubrobacterales bacterium]|jgi:protein SCO1/2|nr:electron transport protein SCO1/SenC [Solirubrobacterales bacterium]
MPPGPPGAPGAGRVLPCPVVLARLQLTLAALLGLLALALGGVLLFGGDEGTGARAPFTVGSSGFAGAVSPPGARAVDFRLQDQDGGPATLGEAQGRVRVLTFLYTTCEDTCPIAASQILGALEELGPEGEDVAALAVSVDPANDTAARARKFLLGRRLTGRMDFALGREAQLRPVWEAYGIQPQGVDDGGAAFDHSARVELIDKRGFRRVGFPLDQLNPDALAHDIRKLQAET